MKEYIRNIFDKLDDSVKEDLKSVLLEKVHGEHWLWCKAVYILYSEILPTSLTETYKYFTNNVSKEEELLGSLHLTQIFGNDLTFDDLHSSFDDLYSIIALRSLLKNGDDLEVQIAETFSRIEKIHKKDAQNFFNDR